VTQRHTVATPRGVYAFVSVAQTPVGNRSKILAKTHRLWFERSVVVVSGLVTTMRPLPDLFGDVSEYGSLKSGASYVFFEIETL
jgi:hypothetical protein